MKAPGGMDCSQRIPRSPQARIQAEGGRWLTMAAILLALCPDCRPETLRRRLLTQPGTALGEASDAATAVRLVEGEAYDAAVLDLDLGARALRRIVGLLPPGARVAIVPGRRWTPSEEEADVVASVLVGRVRAAPPRLAVGDIVMDRRDRSVTRSGRPLHLSPRAYRLLEVLLEHPGVVVSRERLFATVWGGEQLSNVLHAYVRFLRAALEAGGEPRVLHTVRGVGYRLDRDPV